ncbi:hypothetical protein QAD02_022720 [Eretmocerus hayati]|uniref:Uncharacterized protein n=1 Tax=Eretmocerus hayati TaxID=131215 RepID=A0ACC2PVF7_9HYME|nr:hypothetical protein QAD02_022720 [Eretmocerus hayati]
MYFPLLVVLALIAAKTANAIQTRPEKSTLGIWGGHDTTIQKHPYQVSIENFFTIHLCGATMISPNYVLTTAQCAPTHPFFDRIRAGTTEKGTGGSTHKAVEIIIHEGFDRGSGRFLENNICLIKVDPPFNLDETRQPIPLYEPNEETRAGEESVITGWGYMSNGSKAKILQEAIAPVVDRDQCENAYKDRLPEGTICVGGNGTNFCFDDEGGPTIIGGRLAGIISQGWSCGNNRPPTISTEVAAYHDWIMENMSEGEGKN